MLPKAKGIRADLNDYSDPRPAYDSVNRNVEDVSVRLHNWDLLVKNVRGFYRNEFEKLESETVESLYSKTLDELPSNEDISF
ncbi:hypothetical protein RRG08_048411 [Elysia crispata]|uniref:Uncharacterized protein n=1 Tax=Elysia crispata TaxID=231223 RepID=A0AAE1EBT2_9GAST|nr:hypothetical protein RRG08_048411 [Elysia crispata]